MGIIVKRLVLSGPAGPFCVGVILDPCRICTRSTLKNVEKKLEKQNWWSTAENSYAATNFQPIHLRDFPYYSTINNLRSHGIF